MKSCFMNNYKKYNLFKNEQIQQIQSKTSETDMKLIETFYKDKVVEPKSVATKH